jgi:cytochrome P450
MIEMSQATDIYLLQTSVSIQAFTLNRDPYLFHSATSFIPERWLQEASDPASPYFNDQRDALQPFSVGPRACMGKHLAMAEMQLILSKLLWTYDFEPCEPRLRWEDLRTFLLVEKKPLKVIVKVRA